MVTQFQVTSVASKWTRHAELVMARLQASRVKLVGAWFVENAETMVCLHA